MRRISVWLLLLTALWLAVPAAAGATAPRSFVWERLTMDVEVLADGRLHVTETLTLRYTGGPFTFVKRNLASANLDGITGIAVSDAAQPYQQVSQRDSRTPYTFSVFIEDGVKTVRWVYPPTSNASRTFTLSYTVIGAVGRYPADERLVWPIVFPARAEVVEMAIGRIRLPAGAPAAQVRANMPDFQGELTLEDGVIRVAAANIPPKQKLTLVVFLPAGATSGETPAWQLAAERQEAYDATVRPNVNLGLGVASGLVVAALAVGLRAWRRRWRDPAPAGGVLAAPGEPPEDWPPALATHLTDVGDIGAPAAFSATLFDLARRGYLALVEKKGGLFGRSRVVYVTRTQPPADVATPLTDFEAETLDLLFGAEDEVELSKRATEITKGLPRLKKIYQQLLVERGYLDERRLRAKNAGVVWSIIVFVVSMVLAIVAIILGARISGWLPAIPGALFVASLVWLIMALEMRGVTPAGAGPLAEWRAFGRYLKRLRPERAPLGQFERLLPYVAGLASVSRFVKVFKRSNEPLPAWYHPLAEGSAGDAWAGVSSGLLLRDFSDGFASAAIVVAASSGASSGAAGGAGGGAGGGSAG